VTLHVTMTGSVTDDIQSFYGTAPEFAAKDSSVVNYDKAGTEKTLTYSQPSYATFLRIDFGGQIGSVFKISRIWYSYGKTEQELDLSGFTSGKAYQIKDLQDPVLENGVLTVESTGKDPFIIVNEGPTELAAPILSSITQRNIIKNIVYTVLFDLFVAMLFVFRKRFSTLPVELYQNRKLIMQLAKNDFKTRYAGSVLGITWAFVQPAVTVLIYWFVFQVGLHSGDVTAQNGVTYPFVLWLVAGLVPWFFFQDTLLGGTGALLEYSYLVKKVVFKISILPIVKEISALFVHIFFIGLMILLFTLSGHFPGVIIIQLLYYTGALFLYSLGVCYATCSIVIFFRDLSQIINIIIQVQVWLTPIMWNLDTMGSTMPGWLIVIFKLNPLYYIANGYRDTMMNHVWFWNRFDLTIYFWIVTVIFFGIGTFIFKRLKVHFADIL
jgi:teichoic acid transport system permease protein